MLDQYSLGVCHGVKWGEDVKNDKLTLSNSQVKNFGKSDSYQVLSPFCFCLRTTRELCFWFGAMALHLLSACRAWTIIT